MVPRDPAPSDAELMQRFGEGDDEAFHALVERHQRGLLNFFYRRCWDRDFARDCVQEVFLRLIRHRGRWTPRAKFTTYMYRIAENYWIDRYRSRRAAPGMASLDAPVSGADGSADGVDLAGVLPGGDRAPGDLAAADELGERIRAAVDTLTHDQRQVFDLAQTKGLRYADIGELLGIPVGTVKSRMHAAVQRFAQGARGGRP